jgi:F-type H+-transporting ATPase subunit b
VGWLVIELNLAFFVQLFNFVVLIVVLNIFLYKPIRRVLNERNQVIESAREKAASVDLLVQDKMAEYEARLREVKSEAAAIRSGCLKQAQAEEAQLLESAKSQAAASLGAIREKIALETAEARKILTGQAESLSGEICNKILGRSL